MKFLRSAQVAEKVGLSKVSLWRLEKLGKFPKRRQLGPNSVAWVEQEIEEWMRQREVVDISAR
jgi:prophage regulatory protein